MGEFWAGVEGGFLLVRTGSWFDGVGGERVGVGIWDLRVGGRSVPK